VTAATLEHSLLPLIARHCNSRGALLPILHDVQEALGYVPAEAVPIIANALNLSRAEVHGTISFYHDFRRELPTRPIIKLCRAEACQARGAEKIASLLEDDGRVEVEAVYCLGLCATGPNAMFRQDLFSRLDEQRVLKLIERAAET
jgi:formate dehydrogenase subunit gamma